MQVALIGLFYSIAIVVIGGIFAANASKRREREDFQHKESETTLRLVKSNMELLKLIAQGVTKSKPEAELRKTIEKLNIVEVDPKANGAISKEFIIKD